MKIVKFFLFLLVFVCPTVFADELLIEPDAGRQPVLSVIQHANSSVELAMYGMTDRQFVQALIQAQDAHKNVVVMLEPHPYKSDDENVMAINSFHQAKLPLFWPSTSFQLLHQKTLILDHRTALVMTFNFTHSTFKNERNFALRIDNDGMVKEIDRVFQADSAHKTIVVSNPDLVWSPDNARKKILDLIRSAKTSINIYAEDLSDYQVVGALARAARAGVKIKILLSVKPQKFYSKKFAYLERAGVEIRNSHDLIIHAKVIMVDQKQALVGSINLTKPSMDDNRELGVITRDGGVLGLLDKTFAKDWVN